jgi:hypothetical protein
MSFLNRSCYAVRTVAFLATMTLSLSSMAQGRSDDLGRLADDIGKINAWRNIPGVLLERCADIAPQDKDEMQQSMNAWSKNNADLVAYIDRLVDASAPLFARSMSLSLEEAKMAINEESRRLIIENYFEDKRFTPLEICSDYKNIVAKLSSPGTVGATRGSAYSIEANLSSRKK